MDSENRKQSIILRCLLKGKMSSGADSGYTISRSNELATRPFPSSMVGGVWGQDQCTINLGWVSERVNRSITVYSLPVLGSKSFLSGRAYLMHCTQGSWNKRRPDLALKGKQ